MTLQQRTIQWIEKLSREAWQRPGATQDGAVSVFRAGEKLGSAIIGNGLIVIGNDPDPASSHRITDSQLVTERCHEHVKRDSLLWDYATLLLIHFILPVTQIPDSKHILMAFP